MTWFKVDDGLHSHPKAMASSLAALGLWALAGSWSGKHLTDGFIPDHAIPSLSRGQDALARELVAAGLWTRVRGGYRFHDWAEMNPTKAEAIATRSATSSGGTLGNHRRWHLGMGRVNAACRFCQQERRGTDRVPDRGAIGGAESPDPTRPVIGGPSTGVTTDRTRASPEPPLRCPEHLNAPSGSNCGPCADARRSHDRWRAARDARLREAPQCRRPAHRGQPADNCALCRSERIAGGDP